jgi:hypothetical protein
MLPLPEFPPRDDELESDLRSEPESDWSDLIEPPCEPLSPPLFPLRPLDPLEPLMPRSLLPPSSSPLTSDWLRSLPDPLVEPISLEPPFVELRSLLELLELPLDPLMPPLEFPRSGFSSLRSERPEFPKLLLRSAIVSSYWVGLLNARLRVLVPQRAGEMPMEQCVYD